MAVRASCRYRWQPAPGTRWLPPLRAWNSLPLAAPGSADGHRNGSTQKPKSGSRATLMRQVRFLRNAEHQVNDVVHPFRRRIAGYLRSRCWFRPCAIKLTDLAAFTRPCVLRCAFPDPVNSALEPSLRTVLQIVRQGLFADLDSGFMFDHPTQKPVDLFRRARPRQWSGSSGHSTRQRSG